MKSKMIALMAFSASMFAQNGGGGSRGIAKDAGSRVVADGDGGTSSGGRGIIADGTGDIKRFAGGEVGVKGIDAQ